MKINRSNRYKKQSHRVKTDSYYLSKKHKELREQAYLRDNGLCRKCGKMVELHTTKNKTNLMSFADHIIPRNAGGTDELNNYQTLCKSCHDAKSNKDKKHYGGGINNV